MASDPIHGLMDGLALLDKTHRDCLSEALEVVIVHLFSLPVSEGDEEGPRLAAARFDNDDDCANDPGDPADFY